MVERGEHENEWGGYFVMKGHEKLIRMLLMTRKNFPIAVQRNTWRDRGQHFGDTGIMVRSVRTDQTATVSTKFLFNFQIFCDCFIQFFKFLDTFIDKCVTLLNKWHCKIYVYLS